MSKDEESESEAESGLVGFYAIAFASGAYIVAYLFVFAQARRRDPEFFAPHRPEGAASKASSFVGLVKTVVRMRDDEIVDSAGMDAFLWVLRARMNVAVGMRCLACAIALSTTFAFANEDANCDRNEETHCTRAGFARTSLLNVPIRDWRMWGVPFAAWIVLPAAIKLVAKYDALASKFAYERAIKEAPINFYAVVMTDLPHSLSTAPKIRAFFARIGLGDAVVQVHPVRSIDWGRAGRKGDDDDEEEEEEEVMDQSHHAVSMKREAEKMKKAFGGALRNIIDNKRKPGVRKLVADYEQALAACARADAMLAILLAKEAAERRSRAENESSLKFLEASMHFASKASKAANSATSKMASLVADDERTACAKARRTAEEKRQALLAYVDDQAEEDEDDDEGLPHCAGAVVVFRRVAEALMASAAPLVVYEDSEVIRSDDDDDDDDREDAAASPEDDEENPPEAAADAQQDHQQQQQQQQQISLQLAIEPAPEPRDIIWGALEHLQPAKVRQRLRDQGNVTKTLTTIYFLVILSATQAAAATALGRYASNPIVAACAGSVPALIQTTFLDLAAEMMRRLAVKCDGIWSQSGIMAACYRDFSPFLLINFMLANLLGGSLTEALQSFGKDPSKLPKLLGAGVVGLAPYFAGFAVLRLAQLLTKSDSGLRVFEYFQTKILVKIAWTKRERDALYAAKPALLAVPASWADLFLCMTLLYTPFGSAPTVCLAVAFLLVDLVFSKYKVSSVYYTQFDTKGAALWPLTVDHAIRSVRVAAFIVFLVMLLVCDKTPPPKSHHTFWIVVVLLLLQFYLRDKAVSIHRKRKLMYLHLKHSRGALPLLAAAAVDQRRAPMTPSSLWGQPHVLPPVDHPTFAKVLPGAKPVPPAEDLEHATCVPGVETIMRLQDDLAAWLERHQRDTRTASTVRVEDERRFSVFSRCTSITSFEGEAYATPRGTIPSDEDDSSSESPTRTIEDDETKLETLLEEEEEKPRSEEEKPRSEEEKPQSEEEKPRSEVEKPQSEVEKPRSEEEKPQSEEEKPQSSSSIELPRVIKHEEDDDDDGDSFSTKEKKKKKRPLDEFLALQLSDPGTINLDQEEVKTADDKSDEFKAQVKEEPDDDNHNVPQHDKAVREQHEAQCATNSTVCGSC
ncbi:hypothetical protein CTAYLR_000384 [Chrysophaeum taylorii]|uniref:CSC1/OSCA1-like 7TM region domain-containing protein n=1 Tax=Chrysophaeum taylorii TaxID=2483200 RepID=A0AAD7UG08_9STRA|nr:hypothetical protein CTAYLR_000384 [Chrysophaeum taylorii]